LRKDANSELERKQSPISHGAEKKNPNPNPKAEAEAIQSNDFFLTD